MQVKISVFDYLLPDEIQTLLGCLIAFVINMLIWFLVLVQFIVQFFVLLVVLVAQIYSETNLLNFHNLVDLLTEHPYLLTMVHIIELQLTHEPHEFVARHLHITPFSYRLAMSDVEISVALIKLHLTLLELLEGCLRELLHFALEHIEVLQQFRKLLYSFSGHYHIFSDVLLDERDFSGVHFIENSLDFFLKLFLHFVYFVVRDEVVVQVLVVIIFVRRSF